VSVIPATSGGTAPDPRAITEALAEAAVAAGHAPSIHNTQPWRWRLDNDTLELLVERSRLLGVTDPDRRLAILSCGTALHHARVALSAQGLHEYVERMPDSDEPDLLARVRILSRIPVTAPAMRLLQTIAVRYTDRRPVTGDPVTPADIEAIAAATGAQGAWLHRLRRDQVIELAAAADRAQQAESADPAWREEMAYWTGGDRTGGTGVPDAVIPAHRPDTMVPGRDFGHAGALPTGAEHDAAAAYALLYGQADEMLDWLRAGEALSAAWLTATELGVSLLPLSGAVEVPGTRRILRGMLAGTAVPYLVLRLGRADPEHQGPPHTPRLNPAQIIQRE